MNKRKRTAYRRAALWVPANAAEVADAINDRAPFRMMSEVVFARGVWHDDGREFKRIFPDRWEELLNTHLDARRAGEIPWAEMLTVAPDDGTSHARFRADMATAQAAGIVWPGAECASATLTPITRAEG